MNLIFIALFVVAGIIAFLFMSFNLSAESAGKESSPDKTSDVNKTPAVTNSEMKKMTRAEILEKLKALKNSEPPKKLALGALCYETAVPPNRAEYVCPKCGEKTIYPNDKENIGYFITFELASCRRNVSELKKARIDAELDESSFCSKCSKDKSNPELALIVKYPDQQKEVRTSPVFAGDLIILTEFAQNKKTHTGVGGGEAPLKNHLDRIEKLLGVSLDK